MNDLSPLAKQLVKAGQRAHQPTGADKQRIHAALQERLGLTPPKASEGPSTVPNPTAPFQLSLPLVSGTLVGAAVIAGALYWSLASDTNHRSSPAAPPPPRAVEVESPMTAPEHEQPAAPPEPAPAPASSEKSPALPRAKSRESAQSKGRLAEEVALLSRATSALHAGRAEEALSALAEHRRKFPGGLLSVERSAARAQALCMLGRKAEAERELAQLSPQSPQTARARQVCSGK